MYSISFHHPVSEKNSVFRGWWRRFSVLSVCLFFTFVLVKTKARRQLDVERAHEGGRKRGREKEGERGTEGLLLSEFWGNSEKKVVFCSGVTLNKPITPRGALPSVCSRTPPSSLNLPHHAALGLPLQPKAELLWLQRRQKNRRGGVEREREGGQHAENEGRNGTGRFVYRSVDHNISHTPCNQINNRT